MDEDDPADEMSQIEARIEELAELAERCRKVILVSRAAIAGGYDVDSRVRVESGATIDVSGSDVTLAASRRIVAVSPCPATSPTASRRSPSARGIARYKSPPTCSFGSALRYRTVTITPQAPRGVQPGG